MIYYPMTPDMPECWLPGELRTFARGSLARAVQIRCLGIPVWQARDEVQ